MPKQGRQKKSRGVFEPGVCIARTCPPYGARCCVCAPKSTEPQGGAHWAALVMRAHPPAPPLSEGAKNRAKWASSPARACACASLACKAACMRTCTYQPQMAMGWCHWATRIASRPIGPSQVRGSQGPSHMGPLPGLRLACARLASKAACMHICTFSVRAGLLRLPCRGSPGKGKAAFCSLVQCSSEAAFSSFVQFCSVLLVAA